MENIDPEKLDIFKWWDGHQFQFPMLSRAASALHSIPATSVSSERLFSKATLLFSNNLRNRFKNNILI
jgi:hypothetical protein